MKKILFAITLLISLSACKPNGANNSTDAVNSIDEVGIDSVDNVSLGDTTNMRDTFHNRSHDTTVPPL